MKPRDINVENMVLKAIRPHISDPRGKFKPNWGGPYFVKLACIARMEATLELGAKRLEVIGDSNLVLSQARGD